MSELHIDLDLLLELSLIETRGEGECYINLNDGEFSYIPQGIISALKDESKFDSLESWERELAKEAENIVMDYSEHFLYVPIIDDKILTEGMKRFLETLPKDEREKISSKIDFSNPFLGFSKILVSNNKLDDYYDFRELYLKKYLRTWLKGNNIKVI